ncbi:MAG: hypothetical protein SF339_21780 [Blastocatellia bacterium]|nr:hypothetical protein [Blastocatellia bacterium]
MKTAVGSSSAGSMVTLKTAFDDCMTRENLGNDVVAREIFSPGMV